MKNIYMISDWMKNITKSGTLKARVARGGIWIALGNSVEQMFRLTRNMVLTRILAPEAFGLMAIVMSLNAAFESFTQVGIQEAIIQNPKGQQKSYLNGAWWFAFLRGVLVYGAVFALAPWIEEFYENPGLSMLMRVAFIGLFFNSMLSPQLAIVQKRLQFKRWVFAFQGGPVLGIISTVILAFLIKNVWALAIGFVIEAFARCALSYMLCPFMPGVCFEKKHLRALLKYARGIFGLPILTFVFMRCDIFVVGKLFTMTELGLYSMAVNMAWLPFRFITVILGRIMMPAFSENQKDSKLINRWILKTTALIMFCGIPLFFLALFYGREILSIIYGVQYGAVAVPFAVIFLTAMMRTCSVPIASVYLATGKPEMHRLFTGVRAVLILAIIYPAAKYMGLAGAALAGMVSMGISFIFQISRLVDVTGFNFRNYFVLLYYSIIVSSGVCILWVLTVWFNFHSPFVKIVPGIVGFVISCLIAARMLMTNISKINDTNGT